MLSFSVFIRSNIYYIGEVRIWLVKKVRKKARAVANKF